MTGPSPIVVAGGGLAAVEFLLALREAAGGRVDITLVAPDKHLRVRPQLIAEPLRLAPARRHELQTIADDLDVRFVRAAVASVEPGEVRLRGGGTLGYRTLVLAPGARRLPAFDNAIHLPDGLAELREELERGLIRDVAFVAPTADGWLLPLYEAALLTAKLYPDVHVSLVSGERAPLELFGAAASATVAAALNRAGVRRRMGGPVTSERVVSLPLLRGPNVPGVPVTGLYGLIPVDEHLRVRGLERVYALGDATDHPLKQGAIACQQADAAAAHIVDPHGAAPFAPHLQAVLLTGEEPIVLGGAPGKVPGRHLAPYLETVV